MLEFHHLKKQFGDRVLFDQISYQFQEPGLYLLYGKSGCGKTTLLNILSGYDTADGGTVTVKEGMRTFCMFQNFELIPELNVQENIMLYQTVHPDDPFQQEKAEVLIQSLGLQELLRHYPDECSQGQKQRISIARAVLANADIYFCDEPTEALDEQNINEVMSLITELAKDKIVLMVTHNQQLLQNPQYHKLHLAQGNLTAEPAQKNTGNHKAIDNTETEQAYHVGAVINCGKRIIHKKTQRQIAVIFLCMLLVFGFYCLYARIFVKHSYENIANRDRIYVRYEAGLSAVEGAHIQKIVSFMDIDYQGQIIESKIIPATEALQQFSIEGERAFQEKGIILNQNAASLYCELFNLTNDRDVIGKQINLKLKTDGLHVGIDFVIQGIVWEQDAGDAIQLYYDKTALDQRMHNQKLAGGKMLDEEAYKKSRFYELTSEGKSLTAIYEELSQRKGANVYNSEISQWIKQKEKTSVYLPYFMILLFMLLLFQFTFMIESCKRDWRYHCGSLMILLSCDVKQQDLQKLYVGNKAKAMMKITLLCLTVLLCSVWIYPPDYAYQYVLYCCCCMFLYIGCVKKHAGKLSKQTLALTLKENKDYHS